MAPNRKANVDHHGLDTADLKGFVASSSKNYPTTLISVQEAVETAPSTAAKKLPECDSYWNWPSKSEKDLIIERILEEERIRQVLSVDHISKNLSQESEKLRQQEESKTNDATGDYWDMPSPAGIPSDEARYLTSGEHIEMNLRKAAAKQAQKEQPAQVRAPPNQSSYWDWPEESTKERLIRCILEDERVRQMVQVDHIEKQLVAAATTREEKATPLNPGSDAYWAF
jgi:hypothetical protein